MIEFTIITLFIWTNTILNAYMDKRRSGQYPEWHEEYPKEYRGKTIPHFLWSKFRNKWHVVKQFHFLGNNFVLTLIAVKDLPLIAAIVTFLIIIIVGQYLWNKVPRPIWWN
jgi:hypothetical protein